MASNIRVVLEIDNKKYLADLKTAEAGTKTFTASAERNIGGLTGAFGKVGGGIDLLNKRMIGLKSVIASLAFGAIGRSAIQMADALKDLSDSSGIAVSRLVEIRNALGQAGGEAEQMPTAISAFLRSLDEAANGSVSAQNNFQKLNVTLNDLRRLGEEDLLVKTLQGIAALPTATERATAMMNNFGKSFKTVDAKTMLEELQKVSGTGDRYAESIKRAAELNDALAKSQANLKLALLEAFSQPIQQFNKFIEQINNGTKTMDNLVNAIKAVGVALVVAFSASIGIGFVASLGTMLRGISAITAMVGLGALPAWFIGASGAAARFLPMLRALVLLGSAFVGIFAASQIFDDFASVAINAFQRISEAILNFIGCLLYTSDAADE